MSRELNEAAKAHAVRKMETDIPDVIAGSIESFLAGAAWQRENFDFLEALAERQVKLTGDPKLKAALEAYRSEHNSDEDACICGSKGANPHNPGCSLAPGGEKYEAQRAHAQNEDAGWRKYADCDCDACKPARAQQDNRVKESVK